MTVGSASLPPGLPRIPRDTQISEHVLNTLAGEHPLTVLRGPRGYGKTSAIVTWLRSEGHRHPTIYVTLSTASNELAGFWAELRSGLERADLLGAPASDSDAHAEVTGLLAERREPLVLIIDDFHEAGLKHGAATIDDEMVDLVRQNDQLFLVVGSRTLRALETTGALSVEAAMIGPADLRMTGPQVHDLATRLGLTITMDEAQQIAVDLGGWPSAIRAGLMRAVSGVDGDGDGGTLVDGSLVDGYIATMVRDLRFENVRSFLLRTAIPEQFDIEMARAIAPEGNTVRILRNVRAAGLLSERHTVEGQMYSYAPAIRNALIRVMRESRPELFREVHLALMNLSAANRDPGETLTHAVHAAQWTTAMDVIERQWARLLTHQPLTLIAAARMFPDDLVASNARLRVAVDYVEGALDPHAPDASIWAVPDYTAINSIIEEDRSGTGDPERDESLVLLQWGISSLLGGNLDTSVYAFSRARERGLISPSDTGALQMGTVGLALVHALNGEPDLALRWLEDSTLQDRIQHAQPEDARDIALVAASIARALAMVDAAHPGADEAVATMIEPRHRDELWALTVFIRAHHAVLDGTPDRIFRQTNHLRAALRHIARGSLVEAVLSSTLVELLLVAQMPGVAREVADRYDGNPVAWAAVAKVHLTDRTFGEAISYATKSLDSGGSRRAAVECQVILASAHHALGNLTEARRAFATAVRLAQATGQRRPFFLMQRYVFETLAGDDARIHQLWPGAEGAPVQQPAPLADEMQTLTMREAQVLRALEVHAGPVGIAHDLGLSVNTVKTHLRTIYKKFGVSNRNEALAAAERGIHQA
ncbi:LuxR C-terminal-related transcriptional regulator [Occultella kanbiaonis]|uniref:LuxR C-terminal-related transcriptional regulator n=1 Tax=Occultella kanbiaonis TaxID=2675754 RepID=UPI00143DEAD8|nr:LuxR C-terminal-related transcriptional regulator [Occultella kanbiaonis]